MRKGWINSYAKFGGAARHHFPVICEKPMGGAHMCPPAVRGLKGPLDFREPCCSYRALSVKDIFQSEGPTVGLGRGHIFLKRFRRSEEPCRFEGPCRSEGGPLFVWVPDDLREGTCLLGRTLSVWVTFVSLRGPYRPEWPYRSEGGTLS